MRRRVLGLCVRAYPRSRRERDGDYLRDLALELSEGHGVRREIGSPLRNGLADRVRPSRRSARLRPGTVAGLVAAIVSTLVAARVRDGWACRSSRDARAALSVWHCTLGSAP